MIGMQYSSNSLPGKSVVFPDSGKLKRDNNNNEPISVLDKRSPSPSTSTSASSSSFGAVPAAVGDGGAKEEWVVGELQPLLPPFGFEVVGSGGGSEKFGLGLEDWESFLSESGQGSDQNILRWVSGEFENQGNEIQGNVGFGDAGFGALISSDNSFFTNVSSLNTPFSLNSTPAKFGTTVNSHGTTTVNSQEHTNVNFTPLIPGMSFQEPMNQTHLFIKNVTNPSFGILEDLPLPPAKRQNFEESPLFGTSLLGKQQDFAQIQSGSGQHLGLLVPKLEVGNGSDNVVYDGIYKAAEMILTGQFSHAQMILARLNHQLSRAASYFKEALMLPLLMMPGPSSRVPSPVDFVFKMGAYKLFSEVSPVLQFMNFTSNQALLEALGDSPEYVHIFDFDIGFGAQWSSFMQELPKRNNGRAPPSLKITAFASPSTHHPVEISLMHESLTQFANDVGVKFELEVVNLDTFDPSSYPCGTGVVVVNFPIWSLSSHLSALPSLLHYIKQLSPKIVVSLERGCERTELPFPHHVLNALKYYEVLFESLGAAKLTPEMATKMERLLFQPSIESIVQGRLCFPDQMPPWRTLFASAGFLPVAFSNFTETQAECLMKRNQVRGFHVEKRQASLVLCWQRRELLTAVAWRC